MTPVIVRKPGLYSPVDWPDYQSDPGINHSILRLFRRSAAHAKQELLSPSDTAALKLGGAMHAAILEPSRFMEEYAAAPVCDRRTKDGKKTWAEFLKKNPGAIVLTDGEFESCRGMSQACWEHPLAKRMLSGEGLNVCMIVWEQHGQRCKARIDRLTKLAGWSIIVDIKSTRNASAWAFSKSCHDYGYYSQAAYYLDGMNALSERQRRHVMIAVEKYPPYAVAVYELDSGSLSQGRAENKRHMAIYLEAKKTGNWPGYPVELQTLGIPAYAVKPEEWGE